MKGILRGHTGGLGHETYDLKFKDRPQRNAFRIKTKKGKTIDKIEIMKVPKETNRILVKLYEGE